MQYKSKLAGAICMIAFIVPSSDSWAQEAAYPDVVEQWRQENAARWKANLESMTVSNGDLTMKF